MATPPPAAANPAANTDSTQKPQFELLDNGNVVQNRKGKPTLLALYDQDDGHLQFESTSIDEKYRTQIQRCILEDTEGVLTGNKITSYGIKGRERDEIKKGEPPRPKANKNLGDKTQVVVDWYFKWRKQEFYARYGVRLDSNGEPVVMHCRRKELRIEVDEATGMVGQVEYIIEKEDGMIATRATHLTFTKLEVVGSDEAGEEEEQE
jgi:hypothetical protein